ncbi:MAG: hypothetical protein ACLQNE_08430 [Thermoguttaceae bacterium]
MARYQVPIIELPQGWLPLVPDDVPPSPGRPISVFAESDDLFLAVRRAIEYNQAPQREGTPRWAVVVEPGTVGRAWRNARLVTPLTYKVTAIWWPTGWEPQSPLDVPNCVWRAQGQIDDRRLTYSQAVAAVGALNRQSMAQDGAMWYVILAVENEPTSQTVSYDPSGTETTVEIRRLHVIRPEEGGGKGDCSHCPAHSFQCARADWITLEQTATQTSQRIAAKPLS